ncbi:MAG: DUF1800 family protein [Acidimicrobiales bacterium]
MTDGLAHLLRRATMAAHPDRMAEMVDLSLDQAIDRIVAAAQPSENGQLEMPWNTDTGPPVDDNESWGAVSVWWVNRLSSADAGLIDRLAWTWHNWFTTSDEAFSGQLLSANQLKILYRYGSSDLRTLVHQIVTSGAMLRYLDAAGSEAYNPNENLARELMELYTIGPDNYGEDDVRAGARALAGWKVDDETGEVDFTASDAFVAPLIFLGVQDRWDTTRIVNALVEHPSTAYRISAYLWAEFVGSEPTEAQARDLADVFVDNDLQILPLVERILRSVDFAEANRSRFSTTIEWLVGARAAVDPDGEETELEPWHLENLGQRPFAPPSPAGWPRGDFWSRPGTLLPRLQLAQNVETSTALDQNWTTAGILAALGLPQSDPSAVPIGEVLGDDRFDLETRRQLAWRIALTCPTFQLH